MKNVHLFNVSTSGSSASAWLNDLLNKIGCVSFHALRSDPFSIEVQAHNRPDFHSMGPRQAFCGLRLLGCTILGMPPQKEYDKRFDRICIGAVHHFYKSSDVKKVLTEMGGKNMTIYRNPVHRLDSQFQGLFKSKIGNTTTTELERLLRENDNLFYLALEQLMKRYEVAREQTIRLFDVLLKTIIETDIDNQQSCNEMESLFFERMFSNKEETISKLEHLLDKPIKEIPDEAFATKKNKHVQSRDRVNSWHEFPEALRDRLQAMEIPREQYIQCYKALSYDIEELGF